jgi:hypothetical protein
MLKVSSDSFLYLLLLLLPLVYLPRFLQREIQAIFLLLTHHPEISTVLFSMLFLPGVLLHETSHFLMAHLLGVRTGRFSIIPKKLEGGRLQLGYVETTSTDFFRDALIGAAPLISGGVFVAFAGLSRMGLNTIWESLTQGQVSSINLALKSIIARPDFWLWFYLAFTVSSTMMPSASDRRAWRPLLLVIIVLVGLVLLVGVGPWLLSQGGAVLKAAMNAITIVFGITIMLHLILLPPVWVVRNIISRFTGYQVV